jgi:5-methylcytosine-specific restriction protein A
MSTDRVRPDGGRVARAGRRTKKWLALPKGPHGRALCRQCGVEVPPRRWTFCSDACVHTWKLTTNPRYVRECLFKRDRGKCYKCGLDTHRIKLDLAKLKRKNPDLWWERWEEMLARGVPAHRKTFWDAHHVVAVVEGGGLCGLDNYATLCIFCHRAETIALSHRRAAGKPVLENQSRT